VNGIQWRITLNQHPDPVVRRRSAARAATRFTSKAKALQVEALSDPGVRTVLKSTIEALNIAMPRGSIFGVEWRSRVPGGWISRREVVTAVNEALWSAGYGIKMRWDPWVRTLVYLAVMRRINLMTVQGAYVWNRLLRADPPPETEDQLASYLQPYYCPITSD